jgi:cardiolipin synthase A/B
MSSGQIVSSAYSLHNKVRLIRGGSSYFNELLLMINAAKKSIHLQTYIFDEDETGILVATELIAAATRGVKVYLLVDGYASQNLSEGFIEKLKTGGIVFRWFEPVFHSKHFYIGRRLHHKILVVDAQQSIVAGMNISNRYNDMPGQKAWLDWGILCEGEVSTELNNLCIKIWNRSGWGKKKNQVLYDDAIVKFKENECLVRVRRNDWVRRKNQISRTYLEMFKKAQTHITVMSSYLVPGRIFRKNMMLAAMRGVKIKVIVAGISDVALVKHAERYLYRFLLKNKIEVYEYQPNVLHGKISTYDSKFVTIGSYNVNNLSAYLSVELNIDVLNEPFAHEVETTFEKIIEEDCIKITEKEFELHNSFIKRIWQKICFETIRIIFFVFTFYLKQRI